MNETTIYTIITGSIGTLTGIAGLVISLLNYKRDKLKIKATVSGALFISNKPKFEPCINAVSHGKPDAHIVSIIYRLKLPLIKRILALLYYRQNKNTIYQNLDEKVTIKYNDSKNFNINIPSKYSLLNIDSIFLIDATQQKWKVKWKKSKKAIEKFIPIVFDENEYENQSRTIKYSAFKALGSYYLFISYSDNKAVQGKVITKTWQKETKNEIQYLIKNEFEKIKASYLSNGIIEEA